MDLHDRMRQEVEEQKEHRQLQYEEVSRNRLENILIRKLRTTFIGDISAIEEEFGVLWGHNSSTPLTAEQKKLAAKWQKLRNKILNHGNNQLRAIQNELLQYTMVWNRYNTNLEVKQEE